MNQGKYVEDLLHKLQLTNLKPAPSPSVLGKHLSITDGTSLHDLFIYRRTLGALQYLINNRPDISYMILFKTFKPEEMLFDTNQRKGRNEDFETSISVVSENTILHHPLVYQYPSGFELNNWL